jgi:feruloyl esterase
MPALAKLASHNLPVSKLNSTGATFLRIANHTLDNCDVIPGIDEAKDRIIESPAACLKLFREDPSRWDGILCGKGGDAEPECVTKEQIDIVMEIAKGTNFPGTNELMYDGYDISSIGTWDTFLDNPNPSDFDQDFARYFILQNENLTLPWNETTSDAKDLVDKAREWNDAIQATADQFKLDASFQGKIVMYQGLADGVIPSGSSLRYFNQTRVAYGGDMSSWFRYFPIPGLQHCWNSPEGVTGYGAPWYIGGVGVGEVANTTWHIPTRIGLNNSQFDALEALVEWVERADHPPVEQLIATAFRKGALKGFNFKVSRQRLVCAWPKIAVWDRTNGTEESVDHWSCQSGDTAGNS